MNVLKAIFISLLIFCVKVPHSDPSAHYLPLQFDLNNYLATSQYINIAPDKPVRFPSRGFAIIILRYQDKTGKDKFCLPINPYAINREFQKDYFGSEVFGTSYLPPICQKLLLLEEFLYSTPLRSPPFCC